MTTYPTHETEVVYVGQRGHILLFEHRPTQAWCEAILPELCRWLGGMGLVELEWRDGRPTRVTVGGRSAVPLDENDPYRDTPGLAIKGTYDLASHTSMMWRKDPPDIRNGEPDGQPTPAEAAEDPEQGMA